MSINPFGQELPISIDIEVESDNDGIMVVPIKVGGQLIDSLGMYTVKADNREVRVWIIPKQRVKKYVIYFKAAYMYVEGYKHRSNCSFEFTRTFTKNAAVIFDSLTAAEEVLSIVKAVSQNPHWVIEEIGG